MYYIILYAISLLMVGVYSALWRKRFPVFISLLFSLIPIANFGYLMVHNATTLSEAILGIKITYLGGCYLNLFLMLTILSLCKINTKKWVQLLFMFFSTVIFVCSLTIGSSKIFYRNITANMVNGQLVIHKQYGPIHTLYYIQIFIYLLISVGGIIQAFRKKNEASRNNLFLLLGCDFYIILMFFGSKFVGLSIEFTPLMYVLCEFFFFAIIIRIALYDIPEIAVEKLVRVSKTGYASFDGKFNYLGSNDAAKEVFPQLNDLRVDKSALTNAEITNEIISRLKDFESNATFNTFYKEKDEKIYKINIERLSDKQKSRGFILFIRDDTTEQKYIALLNKVEQHTFENPL